MRKVELVFFPSAGTGHLVSAIELAKLITKTHNQISILVIIFHIPIYSSTTNIESYVESQSCQIDAHRITFLVLPPLSNPPSPTSPTFFSSIVELQKPLVAAALEARPTKPSAFILDMLCVDIIDIAQQLQIPSYIYYTAGASLLNLELHLQGVLDETGFNLATQDYDPGAKLDIPGFKTRVPASVLPQVFCDKENEWSYLIHHISRRFREAKGILVNTFTELQPYSIQALQSPHQGLDEYKIPPVYPIGPIIAHDGGFTGGIMARDSVMRWLDEQPPSSVVFLCFGSLGSFDEKQVKEIAIGLERSGHRFLWSLRKPCSLQSEDQAKKKKNKKKKNIVVPSESETFEEALPLGFSDRTFHRGKVIGWAPQTEVLAHPSIGGFVSHCGWNSILESVWYGVPIAAWPMYADQQLNAFELVTEYELAVDIRIDYRRNLTEDVANIIVKAEEVENGVNKLMSMNDILKDKLRKMKDTSRDVLQVGGSSHTWLTRFINQVLDTL